MRLAAIAFALGFAPLVTAQAQDLRDEIRQIVREEIRAALKELHQATPPVVEGVKVAKAGGSAELDAGDALSLVAGDDLRQPIQIHLGRVLLMPGTKSADRRIVKEGDKPAKQPIEIESDGGTMTFEIIDDDDKGQATENKSQSSRMMLLNPSTGKPIQCEVECQTGLSGVDKAVKIAGECCEAAKAVEKCCEEAKKAKTKKAGKKKKAKKHKAERHDEAPLEMG